jgi:hypothetical protein
MNEINISIPYSLFKTIFLEWFKTLIRSESILHTELAIITAKEYWILFDTDLRKDVVSIAKEVARIRPYQPFTDDFIEWANSQFNAPQDYNTPRPLVDVLPVVDLKPYKGSKKWSKN